VLPALHLGPEEGGDVSTPAETGRRWYVNSRGQTMVVFPGPVEFRMGSPTWERPRSLAEVQHLCKVPRSYALATKPVTVAEFQRFLEANPKIKKAFDANRQPAELLKKYSPEPDGPIILVDWYTAAAYCNWLSQQEGIPKTEWVYPSDLGTYGPKMVMEAGYLRRTGYRLPTEAEWEYACRAEAASSRYYGAAEGLLPRYAWYIANAHERPWPVGQKKANDFGLFDMHGNVWTWCQDRKAPYPKAGAEEVVEDVEDKDKTDAEMRMVRGGSFVNHATNVRSAYRFTNLASSGNVNVGLRPARTYR
jgi:formylglycine-generating enzyme required for sulfatase activity